MVLLSRLCIVSRLSRLLWCLMLTVRSILVQSSEEEFEASVPSKDEEPFATRHKYAFKLATGKIQDSPFRTEVMESTRKQIAQLLPDPDLALQVPCRQPFLLHLVSQFLKILEDPDYSILSEGPESCTLGVGQATPNNSARLQAPPEAASVGHRGV